MMRLFFGLSLLLAAAACDVLTGVDRFVDSPPPAPQPGSGGGASTATGSAGTGGMSPAGGGGAPAASSTATGTSASTGGSPACGDPKATCLQVFVTQAVVGADFGGQAAADDLCAKEAGGKQTFVAWLSTDTAAAVDRIADSPGGYCLKSGARVADCKVELTGGKLDSPIDESFDGAIVQEAFVWTGTRASGASAEKRDCGGWKATDGEGMTGYTDATSKGWSEAAPQPCSETTAHLYCFPKL